jgi:uncharacterized protein YcgL (UPF0745 family)
MQMRIFVLTLIVGFSFIGKIRAADAGFLLVEQEFVKFGKKELYEQQKKEWFQAFTQFSAKKKASSICAIYDHDASQYLYLMPMKSYADIGNYFQLRQDFRNSFSKDAETDRSLLTDSTLNFRVLSFHQNLPRCSYAPENGLQVFFDKPFLHYHIFGIAPGDEELLEKHLEEMAKAHKKNKSTATWRVWKVIFGSDVPKYVVCVFDKTQEGLEKQIKTLTFVDPRMREMLRRDRQGDVEVRRDLSLPSNN